MASRRHERALVSLLASPTVAEAAKASGISQPTLFRYLQDPTFKKAYQEAKKTRMDAALAALQAATGEAVRVLLEVMGDREASPGARVGAARTLLAFAIQTSQLENIVERLEALEDLRT